MTSIQCKTWGRWLRRRSIEILEAEIRLQFDIYMSTSVMTPAEVRMVAPDAAATLDCSVRQFLVALEAWKQKPDGEKLKMLFPALPADLVEDVDEE